MSEPPSAQDRVTCVADLLAQAARESPDGIAVVEADGGRSRSWAELDREVARVSAGLSAEGLVAGYRVVVAVGNRIEFVATYLGVLRAGLVAVPVNPQSTADELARMIADCGARMVVADPDTITNVRAALGQLPDGSPAPRVVAIGTTLRPGERSWDHLVARRPDVEPPPVRDAEALAALLYTSGTSGTPRAAMLSHRALVANIEQVAAVEPPMIGPDDVVLGVLPLFHVYGLNAVLGGVLRRCARLVLARRFDPEGTLDLIEDEACSVLPVAPPVFARWLGVAGLADRLGPVRVVLSGSAPLDEETLDRFVEVTGVPVHQGYGLTECAPVVTSTLCSTGEVPAGSVGAALPGVRLRLEDEDGRAPEGTDPGQILVAGDNLFSGYWPDGEDGPDADGWWATGDVGLLDAVGNLTLVDRVKEIVIVSGFNVYPSEVEDVIAEVDGVRGVAVIGTRDEETGEAVVAYLQPLPGVGHDELVERVRRHCVDRLARFKRPARIEITEELPVGVTGKVQKGRLRAADRRRTTPLLENE